MNARLNPAPEGSLERAETARIAESAAAQQLISERLASFATATSADAIPAEVRARAMHHMLDAAGIAVAAARYDHSHRVLTAMLGLGGEGTVPVIGFPALLSPRDAATVNGYLCHGLDYDDTHIAGIIHPTASVFPAALSAAAMVGASGAEMITAYIVGVEAAARIAAVAKSGFHQVGFHPTGIVGVFGSALAAGRLMGLNARQLAHAQGIAISMASGSLEFVEDGAWNKRLHPGWAAQAGITAAALAREGFVGATRPYEGRFGLFSSFMGAYATSAEHGLATAGLGRTWELMQTAIKPFPACHFTHGCIDAALELRRQGIAPKRVTRIDVKVPAGTHKVICLPEANKLKPANSYDAQFSVQWLTAAALVRGRLGLAELEPSEITDPEIVALTQKVHFADYPDSPFPKAYSGEVIVTLSDGRKVSHREHVNRGAADRPLTNDDIIGKFRANVATAADERVADRIQRAVLGLEAAPDAVKALAVLSAARAR
ncbi:MAG: MmgE/PrpD family protein [Hyphomicrobiaceae bacterium]|nr:MmgE/PrpD family protein [Hyphomicrobiaceae bacterium]